MHPKRYIWLSVFQVIAIICALVAFYFWAPWFSSLSADEATAKFPGRVASSWRAVTVQHGNIREWRLGTPSQNPVGFSLCTVVLFSAVVYLVGSTYYIRKHKRGERPVA
jgi:hypothetical protein